MMKQLFAAALLVMAMAISGCSGQTPSPTDQSATATGSSMATAPAPTDASPTEDLPDPTDPNAEEAISTFTVEPVEGWIFLEAASNEQFKSYNLLEPYVGSANFWIKYFGSAVYSGKEDAVKEFLDRERFAGYEIVSIDLLEYEMPTVRCVINATIEGKDFTLGHYFIDAPGEDDIYFQLSSAPENFAAAQPLWESALKTLKPIQGKQ